MYHGFDIFINNNSIKNNCCIFMIIKKKRFSHIVISNKLVKKGLICKKNPDSNQKNSGCYESSLSQSPEYGLKLCRLALGPLCLGFSLCFSRGSEDDMYSDRVTAGAKRSIRDRLNGATGDDLGLIRSTNGKRSGFGSNLGYFRVCILPALLVCLFSLKD